MPGRKPTPFTRRRAAHLRLGKRGERLAARLLGELGRDVLCRNYTCHDGEIDIVARDGDVLCFVEVKTRRRAGNGRPADAVGPRKRRRISRAARRYLREIGRPRVVYRYDVVEIVATRWRVRQVRYHPNGFTEEGLGRDTRY